MKTLWNDGWSFLETEVGTTYEQAVRREAEFQEVSIPHDWLIYDSHDLYRDGTGWYRKEFDLTEVDFSSGQRVFVIFDAVYMDSTYYLNGEKIGEWKYGYSRHSYEITDKIREGRNVLLVSVNFQNPNSRWYSGAGIIRDVFLDIRNEVFISDLYIHVERDHDDKWRLMVSETIGGDESYNDSSKVASEETIADESSGISGSSVLGLTREIQCNYENSNGEMYRICCTLNDRDGHEVALTYSGRKGEYLVENPRLWDVDDPYLYTFTIQIKDKENGVIYDTLTQKIGFRETRFDTDTGFYLNGRHLKINGVCEHHDLGALGAAYSQDAMRRKFNMLKAMGVNAIRFSHNMAAEGAITLADEMGLLVMSEAFDMWEMPKTEYDYARFFKEWSRRDVESWIRQDRNHPSVIMWSIGNEIYDVHADEHGQEITSYLKGLVEEYDPLHNAVVTFASNFLPWENAQKCADILGVVGYNYSEKYYEEHHEKYPDWVIYGSETASIVSSRGIYHFPLEQPLLAEEDEQCSSLGNSQTSWGARSWEKCICVDRDIPFSMGQFLWTGFDYIGEPTPYHTKNSYFGQIDTAGFPKDAYYVFQSGWTDPETHPMIHIFPYWDWNVGQVVDVRVCSNLPEVELLINARSLGRQRLTHEPGSGDHIIADYRVEYEEGELTAIAYDESGREVVRQSRHSFGDTYGYRLRCYNSDLELLCDNYTEVTQWTGSIDKGTARIEKGIGSIEKETGSISWNWPEDMNRLAYVEISAVDEKGYPVENAVDRVDIEVTGAGRLIGLDNGDSTDCDSYKGTSRKLFSGKLLAIVESDAAGGSVEITVRRNTAEIPVRKITLAVQGERCLDQEHGTLMVKALLSPIDATDLEVAYEITDARGVKSGIAGLRQEGQNAYLEARGDGEAILRCLSRSGTDGVRVISYMPFSVTGLGKLYLDPYDFVAGCLYTSDNGLASNGNDKGVCSDTVDETVITYEGVDFGRVGSDEITMPLFTLNDEEYIIELWEGVPGSDGAEKIADLHYQKPSIWNTYQEESWKLPRRLRGVTTISLVMHSKIHVKGFSFARLMSGLQEWNAGDADEIYGDDFNRQGTSVAGIGNNVSLLFRDMDFGEDGISRVEIIGLAHQGTNTIHVRFRRQEEEIKEVVEFSGEGARTFDLTATGLTGKWDVVFVFMPGSSFDFDSFRFS